MRINHQFIASWCPWGNLVFYFYERFHSVHKLFWPPWRSLKHILVVVCTLSWTRNELTFLLGFLIFFRWTISLRSMKGSLIYYVRKIFQKSNIYYPLLRTRRSAYQGVRNIISSDNFTNVLNEWSLIMRNKLPITMTIFSGRLYLGRV